MDRRSTNERVRARVGELDARVEELDRDARNRPPPFPGIFVQISAFTQDGRPYGRSPLIKVSEDVFVQLIQAAENRQVA
jgi:hypothetical protein